MNTVRESKRVVAWGDRVFWEMSRRNRVRPMVCGVYLALDRAPDFDLLRARVAALVEVFPRLRSRIAEIEAEATPVWIETGALNLAEHLCERGEEAWRSHADIVAELVGSVHESLDSKAPPWRLSVLRGVGCQGLWLRWHHALSDGEGMLQLLGALSEGEREPGPERDLGALNPALQIEVKTGASGGERSRPPRIALQLARARARDRDPRSVGSTGFGMLPIFERLDVELLSELRVHCAVSTNELLIALASSAVARYERRRGRVLPSLRLLSPVSERVQYRRVQLGNHSRALRLHLDLPDAQTPTALVAQVHERSTDAIRRGKAVPYAVYRLVFSLPRFLRERLLAGAPRYIVNYMPWAATTQWIAGARVERLQGFTPMLPYHGCTFACAGYEGGVHGNLVFDRQLLDAPETMVECLEEALDALLASLGGDPETG